MPDFIEDLLSRHAIRLYHSGNMEGVEVLAEQMPCVVYGALRHCGAKNRNGQDGLCFCCVSAEGGFLFFCDFQIGKYGTRNNV